MTDQLAEAELFRNYYVRAIPSGLNGTIWLLERYKFAGEDQPVSLSNLCGIRARKSRRGRASVLLVQAAVKEPGHGKTPVDPSCDGTEQSE